MDAPDFPRRLSQIATRWSEVMQAHDPAKSGVTNVQRDLLLRYHGAAFQYLLGAVRDPNVAEELSQEFALRFVRGDFHRARPEKGRFRDYLRTALIHLVTDYHRLRQAAPQGLAVEPAAPAPQDSEPDFAASWRTEILERTWQSLKENNPSYHAVLVARIDNPEWTSPQLAVHVGGVLQKEVTPEWVRKNIQRAQRKFAELLVEEAEVSIESQSVDQIETELRELDLLRFCRSVLDERR
jgi:RNA polymerase sigma-70 factor (ECF subfamily)